MPIAKELTIQLEDQRDLQAAWDGWVWLTTDIRLNYAITPANSSRLPMDHGIEYLRASTNALIWRKSSIPCAESGCNLLQTGGVHDGASDVFPIAQRKFGE